MEISGEISGNNPQREIIVKSSNPNVVSSVSEDVSKEDQTSYDAYEKQQKERIEKKDAEDLENNFHRAMKGIDDFCKEKQIPLLPKAIRMLPKSVLELYLARKLKAKTEEFDRELESTVFSNITHFTAKDLGQEVELKSPDVLSNERGKSTVDYDKEFHTGFSDIEMGNSHYIFAGSTYLLSRSMEGKFRYKIESKDGYVMPMDIADARSDNPDKRRRSYDYAMYADNVYKLSDFKLLFSHYCAAVFNSPKEALSYLQDEHWRMFGNNDYWFEPPSEYRSPNSEIRLSMKSLLSRARVFPPLAPEFLFKDRVMGKRINP